MPTRTPTARAVLAATAALALTSAGCSRTDPPPAAETPTPVAEMPTPRNADPRRSGADPDPVKLAGALAPAPDGLADVVYLAPFEPDPRVCREDLVRQLARQAFWLAAREEYGLRALDADLGEPAPDRLPDDRHLRVTGPELKPPSEIKWSVAAGRPGAEQAVWSGGEPSALIFFEPKPEETMAAAEALSRGLYARCLAAARFEPRPARRSEAPVPPDVEALLGRTREAEQFAAVRILHDEVRARGESDALVGALARGYAQLGLLTEFHWTQTPWAFKARGLLYAQRLVARSPSSPTARWHRAYAAALAGLHHLALTDLAAAAKMAAADPKAARPDWVEPLDAYLHFDLARLAAARERSAVPFVRLLEYLATEEPQTPAATIRAGRAYLADDPECYRVHDGQCRTGGVAHLHAATLAGPAAFAARLVGRVRGLPGLPKPVAAALAKGEASEADVYAALGAAGDPTADAGTPSWAVLGGLLREVRFTLAWQRLYFMSEKWAVETGDEAKATAGVLAGHPQLPLIESFAIDPRRDPAAFRLKLQSAPVQHLDMRAEGYQKRLRRVDPRAAQAWWGRAVGCNSQPYQDRVRLLRSIQGGTSRDGFAADLRRMSPHAPLAAVAAVPPGPGADAALAAVEKAYAGHAVVQRDLGRRHLADGRPDDAVRCLGRAVELSPDGPGYLDLADAHLARGDEDRWKKTLEASLGQEDTGLHHARARVALAERYMAQGEYGKAEPYATAAAESYAAWALLCAARCQEGQGKWDEAEKLYRATAGRYEETALDWYFASRLTGKLDPAAAEAAAREFVGSLRGGVPPGDAFGVGRYHLLTGRPKEARALLARAAETRPTVYGALFAALSADAAGDAAARDKALEKALAADRGGTDEKAVAGTIRAWATQAGAPAAEAVEGALAGRPPGVRADAEFFAGWLLAARGQEERAKAHWQKCVAAAEGTRWLKTHAKGFLEGAKP